MSIVTSSSAFAGVYGDSGRQARSLPVTSAEVVLWMFLATVVMLFAGFSSAYLVRQTMGGGDWYRSPLPPLVWLNTGVLLLSSVALEMGRASQRASRSQATLQWVSLAALLGVGFIAGQLVVWRTLTRDGITLAASPHGSFFYVLSGVHAVHVSGGLVAMGFALASLWRRLPASRDRVRLCATYWHFMGGLWLYLLVLLFVLS